MSDTDLEAQRELLEKCRARLESELCDLVDELSLSMSQEARSLAQTCTDTERKSCCLRASFTIQDHWHKLSPLLRTTLAQRADAPRNYRNSRSDIPALSSPLAGLQILSDDELTVQLAMRDVIDKITATCNEETFALERRISHLVLRNALTQNDNSFRVSSVCAALESACAAVFEQADERIVVLQLVAVHLAAELPQLYRAINETLIDADILPRLKRSYRDTPPATAAVAAAESAKMMSTLERLTKARTSVSASSTSASASAASGREFLGSLNQLPVVVPTGALTNVLRMAKDSDAARLIRPQDAVTLDIVSALFDLIFSDEHVAEGIKRLVSRLQVPVLKVAMLNQQFFADRGHPARRFLDSISGIAIRWGKSVNASDPFYLKLSELVERIQHTFDGNAGVFDAAIAELGEFIAQRELIEADCARELAEAVRAREDEIAQQREAQARAQIAANEAIAPLLSATLPRMIEQFLRGCWRDVLQTRLHRSGVESDPFVAAMQTANDLVWSVAPKHEADERRRQMALLPVMLKGLNAGLDEIGLTVDERGAFMDGLVELHLSALRAETSAASAPVTRAQAAAMRTQTSKTLQVSHATASGVRVQDISLTASEAKAEEDSPDRTHLRHVRQLVRGDWVDFITVGQVRRERLTWINPSRSLLLFSNHVADCAISITPEALALRLKNDTARLVKQDAPMFERALHGAVQSMEKPS
jgi:hypothetical protein